MKRMIGTVAIALVLVFLTGCEVKINTPASEDENNSTITCTNTEKTSEYELTGEMKGKFENNVLYEFELNTTSTYNDQGDLDDAYNMAIFGYGMMNTQSGINANVKTSGMKIIITVNADINEMDEETIKSMFKTDSSNIDVESLKAYASEVGYTCK